MSPEPEYHREVRSSSSSTLPVADRQTKRVCPVTAAWLLTYVVGGQVVSCDVCRERKVSSPAPVPISLGCITNPCRSTDQMLQAAGPGAMRELQSDRRELHLRERKEVETAEAVNPIRLRRDFP